MEGAINKREPRKERKKVEGIGSGQFGEVGKFYIMT
jgi:hypothetical protein